MAFGRKRKTADSTTGAPEVPEAENPAATVVKPTRTRRKPTPPPAPTPEPAPALDEPDDTEAAPSGFGAFGMSTDHDDEW